MSILEEIEEELFGSSDDDDGDVVDGAEEAVEVGRKADDAVEEAKRAARVKKAISSKPRPKLDPDRLCGQRGISCLPENFKKLSFKGTGHEEEDLDTLLNALSHWAHRLFPKYTFDDALSKIEKLGVKRPVQTCIKKIRLDMPLHLNGQEVVSDSDEETTEVQQPQQNTDAQVTAFDALLDQYGYLPAEDRPSSPVFNAPSQSSDITTTELTSDQILRMEQNRRLAEERRRSRHEQQQQTVVITSEENEFEDMDEIMEMDFYDTPKDGLNNESKPSPKESEKLNLEEMIDLIETND